MKQIIYLIALTLYIRCTAKPDDFAVYASQIKSSALPITFSTQRYPQTPKMDVDPKLFERFKYKDADAVSGKVYISDEGIGILYRVTGDVATPVLMTYNTSGQRIDSLNLFRNASGFSDTSETFITVTLYKDRRIVEVDSTVNQTPSSNRKGLVLKPVIDSTIFIVNTSGKIITSKQTKTGDPGR